jgi:cell wall-associated NlpC family hydrolase
MHHSRLVGGLAACAVLLVLLVSAPVVLATDLPKPNPMVAKIAKHYLGVPYMRGGMTAKGLDAPGLATLAFRKAGMWLPAEPSRQAAHGVAITRNQLRPGDLVFTASNSKTVGVYVGDNSVLCVEGPGTVVQHGSILYDWGNRLTFRRYDANTGYHAAFLVKKYLGVPYVFGGASPSGFDSSGLTMYVYAQLGVSLSHGATDQQHASKQIELAKLRRGDLVFFGNSGYSHHVGIYMGKGKMIDAPHAGAVVRRDPITGAWIGGRLLPVR